MQDHSSLLDASLERAAETLGDLTAPAMARFYAAWPQARDSFEHHGLGRRERLEAEMVQNALYWAMNWLDRQTEITIHLGSSVPHHEETLKVSVPWYRGLLDAVIDVIVETIPADRTDELELWMRIRRELGEMVAASTAAFPPPVCAVA